MHTSKPRVNWYVARSAKPGETCRVAGETHPPWKQTRMNRTPWIPEIFERRIAVVHFVIGIFRSIFRARRVTRNYSSTIIWDADSRNEKFVGENFRPRLIYRVTNDLARNACGQATRTASPVPYLVAVLAKSDQYCELIKILKTIY